VSDASSRTVRPVVAIVAFLNLAYFGVEFAVALAIDSVALFADSIDFLEDTSVNLLILIALGWSVRNRARLGMALAGILLIPMLTALWTAALKLAVPVPPEPFALTVTGAGAFAVNATCAILLASVRDHRGSLTKAAFLSARNDVLANVAIVVAGFATAYTASALPDLLVGLGIVFLSASAAREVYEAARDEHHDALV
jgi:Co/Zn/Cd efflux system component